MYSTHVNIEIIFDDKAKDYQQSSDKG